MASWIDNFAAQLGAQLAEAQSLERSEGKADTIVVDRKLASVNDLLRLKSEHFRRPAIRLPGYHPEEASVSLLTEEQARKFRILPLFQIDRKLYAALADPDSLKSQDAVSKLTGLRLEPVIAYSRELDEAITRIYLSGARAEQAMDRLTQATSSGEEDAVRVEQTVVEDSNAPAVKLVDRILTQAVHLGASDIHLEPEDDKVFLRYRIDGVCHDYPPPPANLYSALVSRIKINSNLDIAERRLPQDGRMSITVEHKRYDLRVSVIPCVGGEAVVVRILNPQMELDLAGMGFDSRTLSRFERTLRKPHGIVLVTGPTGSGKSTTLYATLRKIHNREKKTITLEDPVENRMTGIVQIAVRPHIGYTFAAGLKAILRHDPDVVMLGEIRDLESAEVAFRAALTGHLLFSTLHTNSAPEAVTRLIDMGMEPYQVAAALNGVLAQRLIRKLCPKCRQPVKLGPEHLKSLGIASLPPKVAVFGAKGCSECQDIGYKGRVAVYEFLELTPQMKALPPEQFRAETIKQMAIKDGFTNLKQAAVGKLLSGMTSYGEVMSLG